MRNADRGFTLIELLVVVVIIGVLTAIAIPVFLGQREAGWRAQAVTDMRHTVMAVESQVAAGNGGSYLDVDGLDETDLTLAGWGLNTTRWTRLTISAPSAEGFCVLGHHDQLPTQDLIYRKSEGVVRLGDVGTLVCP